MKTILQPKPSQNLRSLPGVVASWLSYDPEAQPFRRPVTGWLACRTSKQPNLIARLKRDFGPGVYDRSFFFGRMSGAALSLLVFDPAEPGALPPGFHSIGFLDDQTESLLVQDCSARIVECENGAAQAALLLENRFYNKARDLVALTAERLKHVLSCMFWRDVGVSRWILPSGPCRTLQVTLDRMSEDLSKRVEQLSAVIQATRRLLNAQHAPDCYLDISDVTELPSWYGDLQADSYDQHRYFPDCIGPQVAAVLDAMTPRRVTEIGVGTGRFSLAILDAGARQNFTLLDTSRCMLNRLRSKLSASEHGRVTVGRGTLDGLADAPGEVDVLLEHEVFFLHPNPDRLARNLSQALRPDGFVVRLERCTQAQSFGSDPTAAFDRQVAAGLGSPIGFVGEDCAGAVDHALGVWGFQTVRRTLTQYGRAVTKDALRAARQDRTFPYLAHIPEPILIAALDGFSGPDEADLSLVERYDLAISFRSGVVEKDRLSAILKSLPYEVSS
jgi:SAM-dependent methyltransferase